MSHFETGFGSAVFGTSMGVIMSTERRVDATLYYREGTSDKVYQVSLESSPSGWLVNFAYGRRGSTLKTGTKTPRPLPFEEASKIYAKLVREKTAKGYSPGEAGTPYQMTEKEAQATDTFPQLLNAIDKEEADRLIEDSAWWAQEKFDGKRILIRKDDEGVVGINRKGLTTALPRPIEKHAQDLKGDWIIDGEAVGDTYFVFDILERGDRSFLDLPYSDRLEQLSRLLKTHPSGSILLAETAYSSGDKKSLRDRLVAQRKEGVVFKLSTASYKPGRPASGGDQLKLKFTATASCIVTKVNEKRSVALALLDEAGQRVDVGNVTIPVNQPIPAADSVVEVRYLYAYRAGSLYQPIFLGVRDDIDTGACVIGQLKYKAENEEEGA